MDWDEEEDVEWDWGGAFEPEKKPITGIQRWVWRYVFFAALLTGAVGLAGLMWLLTYTISKLAELAGGGC